MCRGHEIKRSHDFEHTRAIVYALAASNWDPKKSMPTLQKFWPLLTDGDGETAEKDDLNERRARLVEYYNKTYGKNLA